MKSIILGCGEVGKALFEVIGGYLEYGKPTSNALNDAFDIMHICFPYSNEFISEVKRYQELFKPKYTVIHSSVPVGTSKKLNAFHSPIRGVHPNLAQGILTFVKYLAPESKELKKYFEDAGITVKMFDKAETTEAIKLWDTTYYGWNILFNKEVKKWCDENNLNFEEVYTDANATYNQGYLRLGKPEVVRPVLKYMEGKIGGHCVKNNLKLFKSTIGKIIEKLDR